MVTQRAREATDTVATTIVTRVEILRGRFDFLLKAADGAQLQRAQHWLDQSEADLRKLPVVTIDARSAAQFDKLRKHKKLIKIGRRDLLIGCIAIANNATLVTRNVKHFRQIPNLNVEDWAD
jgi:tRNA(fMet)-specific endonuclease VapC